MMFESLQRSWEVTKLSVQVMKADRELILFPVLAGIFSLLFVIALLFPSVILAVISGGTPTDGVVLYLILFLLYLGLSVIATFFNVCVVYTAKQRFAGKNATFGESLRFAFSRIGVILAWGVISATVGIILRLIENAGERAGPIGAVIAHMISGLLGAAWAIVTVFVVPGLVYKDIGPFEAIKDSARSLKKTWGENLAAYVGFGIIQLILFLIGFVVFLGLFLVAAGLGPVALVVVFVLAALYVIGVIVFFNLVTAIFRTALYEYAHSGKVPSVYPAEYVKNAFEKKPTRG